MHDCNEILELIALGVDDALTAEERHQLNEHMTHCPDCQALFDDLSAIRNEMAWLEEYPAPVGFADGVLAVIRQEEARKNNVVPLFRRPYFKQISTVAACALLCVGLFRTPLTEGIEPGAMSQPAGNGISAAMSFGDVAGTEAESSYQKRADSDGITTVDTLNADAVELQNFGEYHLVLCETLECDDVSLMTVTEIPETIVDELPAISHWTEIEGGLPYQIIERARLETLIDSDTIAIACYLSEDEYAPSVLLVDAK